MMLLQRMAAGIGRMVREMVSGNRARERAGRTGPR